MLLIRGQPIEQNISLEPFSNILVNIRLAGMEERYKLTIAAHVYFKKTANMIDLISSNTEYIYTSKVSNTHKIILSIGNFPKDKVTKSLVAINTEYGKVTIEDLAIRKVDFGDISISGINGSDSVVYGISTGIGSGNGVGSTIDSSIDRIIKTNVGRVSSIGLGGGSIGSDGIDSDIRDIWNFISKELGVSNNSSKILDIENLYNLLKIDDNKLKFIKYANWEVG